MLLNKKLIAIGGILILFFSASMLIIVAFYAHVTSLTTFDVEVITQWGPFYFSKIFDSLLTISFICLAGWIIASLLLIFKGFRSMKKS